MNKYEEVAKVIRERIESGEYKRGEAIPEQVTLANEFSTSRITVRKAIQLLIVEGLLFCKRGSGTYVRKIKESQKVKYSRADEFFGTTKKASKNDVVTSKILKFEVRFPSDDESDALVISKTDPVYDIIRVRYINDVPSGIEYSIMPFNIVNGLNEDILKSSIYSYINDTLGLIIGGAHRSIQADKATDVDILELKIDKHDPILEIEQVVYLDSGTPFELSRSRYPYKLSKVIADIVISKN